MHIIRNDCVFASSAAVGAILGGAGGLAAYLNKEFNPENDARLIRATIENNDNPNIIINLHNRRTPLQRGQIRERYEEIYQGRNFDMDITNYIPNFHF